MSTLHWALVGVLVSTMLPVVPLWPETCFFFGWLICCVFWLKVSEIMRRLGHSLAGWCLYNLMPRVCITWHKSARRSLKAQGLWSWCWRTFAGWGSQTWHCLHVWSGLSWSAVPAPPLRGDALVHSRKEPGSDLMFVCAVVQRTGAKLRDCSLLSGTKENKPHWRRGHFNKSRVCTWFC